MHSFNDFHDHDSNSAGRASLPNNPIQAPSSRVERTSLLVPVELEYNPILCLSSTVDPALFQPSTSMGEGTHLSAFLPVARLPLLLTDTKAGGSSEFQSNSPLHFDSRGYSTQLPTTKLNALGLRLSDNGNESRTTTAAQPTNRPPSPSSAEALFREFINPFDSFPNMQDPFDELGNINFTFGGPFQGDSFPSQKAPNSPTVQLPDNLLSAYNTLAGSALSYGLEFSSPPQLFSASSSMKGRSNFTGLVADINMFDRNDSDDDINVCVRPQDLSGSIAVQIMQDSEPEPDSPKSIKAEDSLDGVSETQASPPATSSYLRAPDGDWPQIPTEHLPFLVERYLAHFTSNAIPENASNEGLSTAYDAMPVFRSDGSISHPYTPITAEILDAVEEPPRLEDPVKCRKKLADRTNVPRTNPASRPGMNVMNTCDFLIPQDIAIERAYGGVPVVAVAQKTKYFLMTHPGERLSEELLFSFAGRLSTSGQTMPGYRCYVEGCSKTTKRKDHMADHVRTHLGEKPFQCSVCGMGFIRNNDCQRHENNHRPDKKFVCPCKAAFSRRDLFVRHQKTACALNSSATGCFRRPRKYNRASSISTGRKGTPDGDDANDLDYRPGDSTWVAVSA